MSRLDLTAREQLRVRREAAKTLDACILRRTLAVSEFDQGRPVAEIAHMLGVTRQSVYRWMEAYRRNRDSVALRDKPGCGRRSLDEGEEHLLESLLAASPQKFDYPPANWTVALLGDALEIATGNHHSENTLRRALQRLNYVWKRPRYDLFPDPEQEKKTPHSPANSGLAGAERGVGPGRKRSADVSAAALGLVETGRSHPRLADWLQRSAGDYRRHESANWTAVVPVSRQGTKRRLSSLFGRGSIALSRVACGDVAG